HAMAQRLAKLLAAVKAAMGNPALFREALAEFRDPTERHAALLWLEKELADTPSLQALARREREQLEAEEAEAIQAGYNINGVDAEAVGGPAEGRAAYRRTVLGHGGIGGMLEEVLARHGSDDFTGTVEFLRQAVAADLSAATPATDKRELESLNNDLYHLRALANFTREFGGDIAKLRAGGGKEPLENAGLETLRLLCKAKEERLVMLDGLKVILKLEGAQDPVYDVRALTQAQRLAHQLPAKLFNDEDMRQRLLAAGQKLLDAAIDLEEVALAEEG
ncbi:MAG: TyeA family type III secretion system gatekeeper subunit, partial [Planctomycetes bacterium]|nr:TyeA family type III secretion system gatekeeper subunit [Planctomycetota bacterium]